MENLLTSIRAQEQAAFQTHLEDAYRVIGLLLVHTSLLKVEDFHDLSYIRERLQILRKEQEKHAASRAGKE